MKFEVEIQENKETDVIGVNISINSVGEQRSAEELLRKLLFCILNPDVPKTGQLIPQGDHLGLSLNFADPAVFEEVRNAAVAEENPTSTNKPQWV